MVNILPQAHLHACPVLQEQTVTLKQVILKLVMKVNTRTLEILGAQTQMPVNIVQILQVWWLSVNPDITPQAPYLSLPSSVQLESK
jgi:hypothetical protein